MNIVGDLTTRGGSSLVPGAAEGNDSNGSKIHLLTASHFSISVCFCSLGKTMPAQFSSSYSSIQVTRCLY